MSRLAGQKALITGASGGVGRALAVRLAKAGVESVLLARREDALAETVRLVEQAGRRAIPIVGDVGHVEDRRRALDTMNSELGGLDLLINNAGIGAHGRFHEADPERLRKIFDVNFFAVAELTREALPLLKESRRGCVANIGSTLAWRGAPHKSEYSASKFALRGWSEAIRPELYQLGVHVLHASPSSINTGFRTHLIEKLDTAPPTKPRGVTPEQVADRVIRGIERRRNEVAIAWEDWGIVRLTRWVPWVIDLALKRQG